MKQNILWLTRTALFIALLIVTQIITTSLGNTLVTGSVVNLILIVSVVMCGKYSGSTVAVLSPIFAKLLGIGPLWELIPFIILGNLTIVIVWHLVCKIKFEKRFVVMVTAAILGAIAKFAVLYIGIVTFAIPILLNIPEPQARVISNMFSIPQLFTALIGGGIAVVVLPVLQKAVTHSKS